MRKNWVIEIAKAEGRDYITPEDINIAKEKGIDIHEIQQDVLAVLGRATPFGAEDSSLCAFCAMDDRRETSDA